MAIPYRTTKFNILEYRFWAQPPNLFPAIRYDNTYTQLLSKTISSIKGLWTPWQYAARISHQWIAQNLTHEIEGQSGCSLP